MTSLRSLRYYARLFGWPATLQVVRARLRGRPTFLSVERSDLAHPVHLRIPSTDPRAFEQVFTNRDYELNALRAPRTIVDAGANVGFAAVWFANRFPKARIVALEPERENFGVLERNVAAYENVRPIQAALWSRSGEVRVTDHGLGSWGFTTEPVESGGGAGPPASRVRALTVPDLMAECGFDTIDLLKIDIEGAELEVFADSEPWLSRVNAMIVELHERMRPGCLRTFYNGTNGFDREWRHGENVFLSREGWIANPRS